jgi:peptidyl-prolyl cis-trans isomerase B (cyclophilin B)
MKNIPFLLLLTIVLCVSSVNAQTGFTGKPQYNIEVKRADTLMGNIVVEMFPAIAPNHVRNWDSLVSIKFFDSIAFHRVIPGFMIQGGDPNSKSGPRNTWGYGGSETILDAEFSSVSHRRGILSAARTEDPNSASSQFFICVANYHSLDREYSVYGKVVRGMAVADSVVKSKVDVNNNPLVKISMFITKLGLNDSVTAVPKLVSPANDSIVMAAPRATLRWRKVSDAMLYRLQVANDEAFTEIITDTSVRQIDSNIIVNKLSTNTTYYWRVMANNGGNASEYSPSRRFTIGSLSAEFENNFKIAYEVYPNPATESTTISFILNKPSNVTVTVLDMLGRNVLTIIDSKLLPMGKNEIPFSRGTLPAGVYIYRLEAEGKSITKQVVFE